MKTLIRIGRRWSRTIRITVVTTTVAIVPTVYLVANGPLLRQNFEWYYKVTPKLPEHLENIIDEEYKTFLLFGDRSKKGKKANFYCSTTEDHLDSVSQGVLNSPFGTCISLPFYARFRTLDEVYDYCKKNLEPINFQGEPACVNWDSNTGHEIMETMLLSDDAFKFLVQRDLAANESVKSLTLFPFYWCCFTCLAFLSARVIAHQYFSNSLSSFLGFSALFSTPAWWGSRQNAKLDWYAADQSADVDAARTSVAHGKGGIEYYKKMLKRNRLLRELTANGRSKVSTVGDPKKSITSVWTRYTSLMQINNENEMMDKISKAGDS